MSGLLTDPALDPRSSRDPSPAPHPTSDPVQAAHGPERPRRGLRALLPWAVGAISGVAVMAAVVVPPVELGQAGPISFARTANLTVTDFDARGVHSLRYVHGAEAGITVPLRNDGWLPMTVTGVSFDPRSAPMLVAGEVTGVPVVIAPGERAEVTLRVSFGNCEYYTERAIDVYDGVTVTARTVGLPTDRAIAFDHQLVVRSPMMTTCPNRVTDRAAYTRRG